MKTLSIFTGLALGCIYFYITPIFVYLVRGDLSMLEGLKENFLSLTHKEEDLEVIFNMTSLVFIFHLFLLAIQVKFADIVELRIASVPASVSWQRCKIALLILSLLYLFFACVVLPSVNHWYTARTIFLEKYGQLAVIYIFALFSIKMIFLTDLFNVFVQKYKSGKFVFFLAAFTMTTELLITGNRISLLLCFIIFAWACLEGKSIKLLFGWVFVGLFLGVLLAGYGVFRSLQHSAGISIAWQALLMQLTNVQDLFYFAFQGIFESVNINIMYLLTKFEPALELSLSKLTFLKPFLSFIPRSVMPEKFESFAVTVGSRYAAVPGVAMIALLYGEAYYNFGVLYPVFTLLFIVLLLFLLKSSQKLIEYRYLSLFVGFLIVRFPYSDVVMEATVAVLIGLFIKIFFNDKFLRIK
jgi:hypothetical protein